MILFPAIDLKGGACVRLVRGEMASATVFNDDPAAQARAFAATGFRWLHVVDLDGAFAGKSVNGDAVRAIRAAVDLQHPARRRHPRPRRDRLLARSRHRPGRARHRRAARSGTGAPRRAPSFPAASSSASMRATAASRSRAGPRPAIVGAVDLGAALRRCRGRGDRLHRHRPRRRADRRSTRRRPPPSRAQVGVPVIASGGVASLADIAALAAHAEEGHRRRDLRPRALRRPARPASAALRLAAGEPRRC